jgi:pimeloyl-ACP methyl ester carboxylesterase
LILMEECALPDGRRVQLWAGGSEDGPAVLVCHGTPDTRWVAHTGERAALDTGVRLVCLNRPGYGSSTPHASTTRSVADDSIAVLDALAIDRVALLGMSVGGMYAAALAARHPDRVAALAIVAAPSETRTATGSVEDAIEAARPEFEAWAASVEVADPDDHALATRWLGALPPADAALLGRLPTSTVATSAREALACHDGYLRDAALLMGDWAFEPSAIRCPTHLWFGTEDDRNPPATGQWWADRLVGARLDVTPTTHLATLLANWPSILATLRASLD